MGCDIHLFIEKRLRKNDPWQLDEHHEIEREDYGEGDFHESLSECNATGRNYEMFSHMACVRGTGLYEAKGMPKDSDPVLMKFSEYDSDRTDWHSHSWLTLDELKECIRECGGSLIDSDRTDAYFDGDWNNSPPDYTTIYRYCKKWLDEQLVEKMLLDNENRNDIEPEIRIVFWFDN
jgi:hypothetical protein